MTRRLLVALVLAGIVGCSPSVTIEPSDAGPDALPPCAFGAIVCEIDIDCPGEKGCSTEWCQSDKGTATHWCTCGSPNPGIGECKSAADCPPENACWSWQCFDGHCQNIAKTGEP